MKASRIAALVLGALYALLWLGGVVSYLFLGGPPAGTAWTAPAFLAVAALLVLLAAPARERALLLLAAAGGFAAEAVGVACGFPFGHYHYTDTLFPHLLGVPVVMASAWLVLFAYVRQMAGPAAAAAAWMTAIDLVIDPLAANTLGYWTWAGTGPYYGIPWSNFAGWFAVSLALFALARQPAEPNPPAAWLGLSVVVFFTVIAMGSGLYLAGAAGMALVILDAARRLLATRRSGQSTPAAPTRSPAR